MIGQKNLLKQIDWQIQAGCFPRFSIFVGSYGSEKNLFSKYVADTMNQKENTVYISLPDVKIETIRGVIEQSYKLHDITVYGIHDADSMSVQAKNALLKVTEEPPNNAYFVMTLEDLNNTLDTIRSRAVTFQLERYTPGEILEYTKCQSVELDNEAYNIVKNLCQTPGEVDMLVSYGVLPFYNYVEKVVEHIATASGSNVFKMADKIALKDEDGKYDLKMFWKTFVAICSKKKRYDVVGVTSKALSKLTIKGVNKQQLFDMWILEVRKVWM